MSKLISVILNIAILVGFEMNAPSLLAKEVATYSVPKADKLDEEFLNFEVAALHTKGLNDATEKSPVQVDYQIPTDLTGNKKLYVRLRTLYTPELVRTSASFSMSGVVALGPCRWGVADDEDLRLPICPTNINEGLTIAKARCKFDGKNEIPSYTCTVEYGALSEFITQQEISEALAKKYENDSAKAKALSAVAVHFGHEAIGVLKISL